MSEWILQRIDECAEFFSGGTPSKQVAEYWVGTIPWVSPKDMNTFKIYDTEDHISQEGMLAGSRLVAAETILFVVRSMTLANRFQVAITQREVSFNQDIKALRCYAHIDPYFLFYSLLGHSSRILGLVDEATHGTKRLRTDAISSMQIPVPVDIDEQREIAQILSGFDDKIDLNRRMNATLEATARAIFKSWFVDFDPVHAKAEGRQPDGMDAETASLFPDSFEDSALGMIPRGWRVKPLDEIAHFQNGLALQKFPPEGDDYLPVIKIRELRQGYVDANSNVASPNIKESCLVYDGDVLFSWSGSLMVDLWCGGTGALNQHLFKVTSAHYPKWFYLYWTLRHLDEFVNVAADKATTMGHIQRHHLSSALTVVPPDDMLTCLEGFVAPLVEKIVNLRLENRALVETRDTLLPQLISGLISMEEVAWKKH